MMTPATVTLMSTHLFHSRSQMLRRASFQHQTATLGAARRVLSASASPPPTSSAPQDALSANVVQGPSLLQTSVPRSSPSLLFLPGLRSLPFWTSYDATTDTNRIAYQDHTLTKVVSHLEAHVDVIREEYQEVAPTLKSDYKYDSANEHSLHKGTWDWHSYMTKGKIQGQFGQYFPRTTQVLQALRMDEKGLPSDLFLEDIPFGYAFFSTLHPHSNIQAHVSPMNLRWRIHLPLQVPSNAAEVDSSNNNLPMCGIRVGHQVQTWTMNKALVLDDSYDHEVWNNTNEKRVLFLLDIWHPDIGLAERRDIVSMFQHAEKQGWFRSSQ